MSYKFNRNCWVESLEERLFCAATGSAESSADAEPVAIEELIASAQCLFSRHGESLMKDRRISDLIERLERNLENSRECMHELGIFRACAFCDETSPEGSCCSRGLERKYSPVLLLMNLLLGVEMPASRLRADSCYFLAATGCSLKVRHMLCIDYLCPDLEESLGRKSLIQIQTVSGEEIESAFLLHEAVKSRARILLRQ